MRRLEVDVAVIGAGAAGSAAALRLAAEGRDSALLDKAVGSPRPFCGEFLSGEAHLTLDALGALERIRTLSPATVRRSELHSARHSFSMTLETPGLGLTRTALDAALLELVAEAGVDIRRGCEVRSLERVGDRAGYRILTAAPDGDIEVRASAVIGAWGKRSPLDRTLQRRFLVRASPWVGVKARYAGATLDDAVALYLFPGGHCGFVNVEGRRGTLAMLVRKEALKRQGSRPQNLISFASGCNPALANRLRGARMIPDSLMTIAQVPLRRKEAAVGGVFLAGDAAGITAPFLGLGVANALRSGVSAAECVAARLRGACSEREALRRHSEWWQGAIGVNQRWSFAISALLSSDWAGATAVAAVSRFPSLADLIYRSSRGSDWRARRAAVNEMS